MEECLLRYYVVNVNNPVSQMLQPLAWKYTSFVFIETGKRRLWLDAVPFMDEVWELAWILTVTQLLGH